MTLTWDQVLAWRMQRQFVLDADARSVPQVVDRICGVQAQVASSADLAIRLRLADPAPDSVSKALTERHVFKTWAMRGTLHLLTARTGPAFLSLMASGKSWERPSWERYFGLSPKDMERLRHEVHDLLGDGLMTREELVAAITAKPGLDHAAQRLASGWGTLLKPIAWHGMLAFGPMRGTRVTFMRTDRAVRDWPGIPSPEQAAPIAIRAYLAAYGPSSPETFSTWLAGGYFSRKQLRAWFADVNDAVTVDVEGEQLYLLREHVDELAAAKPTDEVRLLGGFDQYVLAPTTRDLHLLDLERRKDVSRTSGWIAPIVVAGGRIRGTWETKNETLSVEWFKEAGAAPKKALTDQCRQIGDLLGRQLSLAVRSG